MTGDVIAGPPPRALPQLEVFFKDNAVYVKALAEKKFIYNLKLNTL